MYFSGTHPYSLDAKGRLAIPARFRVVFADSGEDIRLAPSIEDPHVKIFPRSAWEELSRKIDDITQPRQRRAFRRAVVGGSHQVALDAQGRVLIPQVLRDFAGIHGDVLIVGEGDHLQIWSPDRWQSAYVDAVDVIKKSGSLLADMGF